MISPITWLWNTRHRKLIEKTKALIRLQHFLRRELRFKEDLSAKELKALLSAFRTAKKGLILGCRVG